MDAMTRVAESERTCAEASASDLDRRLRPIRGVLGIGAGPVFLGGNNEQADDARAFPADADGVAQSRRIRPREIKKILRFRYDDRACGVNRTVIHSLPREDVGELLVVRRAGVPDLIDVARRSADR